MADRFAPGLFEADHYSPTRNKYSHCRNSPLKPMFSRSGMSRWRTARFACRTFRQFRMFADTLFGTERGGKRIGHTRLVPIEVRSAVFENQSRLFDPLNQRCSVHIVIFHDICHEKGIFECLKINTLSAQAISDSFGQLDVVKSDRDCEATCDLLTC